MLMLKITASSCKDTFLNDAHEIEISLNIKYQVIAWFTSKQSILPHLLQQIYYIN